MSVSQLETPALLLDRVRMERNIARMRERIRETFGRYVDRRIAEQLIGSQDLLAERGARRDVAVMFCDLAGFAALSERV